MPNGSALRESAWRALGPCGTPASWVMWAACGPGQSRHKDTNRLAAGLAARITRCTEESNSRMDGVE